MRVDFYQLSGDPVERAVAQLTGKAIQAGERVLVVCRDTDLRQAISDALWAEQGKPGKPAFLAHGIAGEGDETRQPILLSATFEAPNGAGIAILADGEWRAEAESFARVMLMFDAAATEKARELWRSFAARDDIDNRIFKQGERGGWREGA